MDAKEACEVVRVIDPKVAIPMHYGTFDAIYQDPNEFASYVGDICDSKVMILEVNETIEI